MLYYTGYDKVRSNLMQIIDTLKSIPVAREKLILHYIQHQWLDIMHNPAEDELIRLALVRIQHDPSQFDLFIDMLCNIPGMDLIVVTLTRGKLRCSTYMYTY